ncbi:MAG: DNA glycosylase [Verrucomicrobiae bacterium]|nr:DNA glycosylase [Verrucomicrobiae bacterium]
MPSTPSNFLPVTNYSLWLTLNCGQAFAWEPCGGDSHVGVIGTTAVRVTQRPGGLEWLASRPLDPAVLRHYFQTDVDFESLTRSFPANDPHVQNAVRFCRGMRLLRQDPWECLASFLLSPLKQIVQIRQVVATLKQSLGESVEFQGHTLYTFPSPGRVAQAGEKILRACKMGFRARNLQRTAAQIAAGEVDLAALEPLSYPEAVTELCRLHGVGKKIADCVLLFAYGKQEAFPIDVWIERVLHRLYFPKARKMTRERLEKFAATAFGPNGGYVQQYLFHYIRHHPQVIGLELKTPRARMPRLLKKSPP